MRLSIRCRIDVPWPRSDSARAPGSRRRCGLWRREARMRCGSRRWPRSSGYPRAASTGTSTIAGRCSRRCSTAWEKARHRGRHRDASRAGRRPARQAAAPLRAGPVGRLSPSSWHCGTGRGATATSPSGCGGSTTGAWPTCARCSAVLRGRGRRRGAAHAGLLAVHRQLLHRRRARRQEPRPRCCGWQSIACSPTPEPPRARPRPSHQPRRLYAYVGEASVCAWDKKYLAL